MASAHIGGTTKDDLHLFMKQLPLPQVSDLPEMINPLGVSLSNSVSADSKKLTIGAVSKVAVGSVKFGAAIKVDKTKTSGLGRDQTT